MLHGSQVRLDLSRNRLRDLPSEMSLLPQLSELYLGANFLEFLPPELNKLSSLTILDVKENNLTEFREEMFSGLHLHILDISSNKITTLPPTLGLMTSLKVNKPARQSHLTATRNLMFFSFSYCNVRPW